ncbi:hypothetical protein A6B40_02885 [Mannheimia varigena]|uniref:hypothetical protein n=1 Tax=Mannheimia varigena TaxID=85404 RepID=UPI00159E53C7|nr:hypothetical protein [Mannheimia varigena]QLB16605.1 hypothetical protein A6B40_02885 [Mannheimia varigena]
MPITDCRGEDNRVQLVHDFEILPLAHVRLLNGQTRESCAGPTLDREYYVFSYQNYVNSADAGTFVCGITVAHDFINLIQQRNPEVHRLPLFDPLAGFAQVEKINNADRSGVGRRERLVPNWNPVARELYEAISIICLIWNLNNIGGALEHVLLNLVTNPMQVPRDSDIRSINTIISNHFFIIENNKQRTSLALCFQSFMRNNGIANPPLVQFPNLTAHFNNQVVNPWNSIPYFD